MTKLDQKGREREIASLKEGDFFGESALIHDRERGASVSAVGNALCLHLGREEFQDAFGKTLFIFSVSIH